MSEEIDRDDYARKREELDKLIAQANEKIAQISKYQAMEDSIEARVNAMREVIEGQKEYNFTKITEDIIRAFVDKIVVYEDYLEWHLIFDETTQMRLSCTGQKRNHEVVFLPDTPLNSGPQHRLQSAIRGNKPRKSYFFMTLYVTKEDVMRYFANVPEYTKVNAYKDMRIDIYI